MTLDSRLILDSIGSLQKNRCTSVLKKRRDLYKVIVHECDAPGDSLSYTAGPTAATLEISSCSAHLADTHLRKTGGALLKNCFLLKVIHPSMSTLHAKYPSTPQSNRDCRHRRQRQCEIEPLGDPQTRKQRPVSRLNLLVADLLDVLALATRDDGRLDRRRDRKPDRPAHLAHGVDQRAAESLVVLRQGVRGEEEEGGVDGVGAEDGENHSGEAVSPVCGVRRDGDGEEQRGDADTEVAKHEDVIAGDVAEDLSSHEGGEAADNAGGDEADGRLDDAQAEIFLEAVELSISISECKPIQARAQGDTYKYVAKMR